MKIQYLIGILFFLLFWENKTISQIYVLSKDTLTIYKQSKFKGNNYKGHKIGLWVELSTDGTIYSEKNYDSLGYRSGQWKINFPNGDPRIIIDYSNDHPVKWTIIRFKHKIAEVSSDTLIPDETFECLEKFENNMFNFEKYSVDRWSVGYKGTPYQGMYSNRIDPFEEVNSISKILITQKFIGILLVWNKNNTINNKREYSLRGEYKIIYSYNKKKQLTKQQEFKEDKIIRTITFKDNGEQKIKTY